MAIGGLLSTDVFLLRLLAALVLGALIGLERQWRQGMAGTRTNALVAAGSATFVMVGYLVPGDHTGPARIAGQIVSGIGFLGAGVILKEGANVRGLNTAATVWCSSAIGTMAGIGHPLLSLLMALGVLVTNIALRPLAYRLHPALRPPPQDYQFTIACLCSEAPRLKGQLLEALNRRHLHLVMLQMRTLDGTDEIEICTALKAADHGEECLEKLVAEFAGVSGVSRVRWDVAPPPVS